ncbi:MAG: hypothetical protein JWM59_1894 [Verrucomicrobiales bacterium]|nr:hypothetical protein [Verrucomicrobiales bacterium]
MFEFHGWATIQSSVQPDADELLLSQERALEFVRSAVGEAQDKLSLIDVMEGGNSLAVLRLHGLRNHRRDGVLQLFKRIAAELPASYGILYIHDPEDPVHDNCFRVFRMARGQVEEFVDQILSPRIPTIEDAWCEDD